MQQCVKRLLFKYTICLQECDDAIVQLELINKDYIRRIYRSDYKVMTFGQPGSEVKSVSSLLSDETKAEQEKRDENWWSRIIPSQW